MRLPCPCCRWRDLREFTYKGAATYLHRPALDDAAGWDHHLHNRTNPAGETRDLWYHDPCGTWICVTRDTVSHEVNSGVALEDAR